MRKQTKLAVGISAAALLAIGASMTSFAAKGWVNEGDAWYYYDNNGDKVEDKWKNYNGNYFYLGDDGAMLTNELIDDDGNYYYVDANGVMVKNTWVAIAADEDETEDVEYRWYYFGSGGKAYRDSVNRSINGKKYGFDDNGKMLFGFVDADGVSLNDTEDAILECTYYFGSNDDGARYKGWLKYEDGLANDDYDEDYYWFWFSSQGKKRTTPKKISGKYYNFDAKGVMQYGWDDNATEATNSKYYSNSLENGSLQKNAWIWAKPSTVLNASDKESDTYRWFRSNNQGYLYVNQTKKINSKWYAFDEDGIMKYGLVTMDVAKVSDGTTTGVANPVHLDQDVVTADDIYALTKTLYYFSDDEEKDGSMKTGKSIKISLADDDYVFGFKKTTGNAINGVDTNKLYKNGIRQDAGDDKYCKATLGTKEYLVGTSGTVMKAGHWYKDADDNYWAVKSGNNTDGYTIVRCATEAEAKAALK